MMEADKRGAWGVVVRSYVERKVRGMFRGVWLHGELPLPNPRGLLVYGNHPGFWDGFILHQLCVCAGWDGYCFMDEDNLVRYPFLKKLGAFSVQRRSPRSVAKSFAYARGLLRQGKTVFILAEGELNPSPVLHPLQRGVELLARGSEALCVPLALRYAFLAHERPEVLVAVGEGHAAAPLTTFTENLSELVQTQSRVTTTNGLRCLVKGRPGAAERWDALRS